MVVVPLFFTFEVADFFTDFLAPIHYLDAFAQHTGPGQGAYCIVGCRAQEYPFSNGHGAIYSHEADPWRKGSTLPGLG